MGTASCERLFGGPLERYREVRTDRLLHARGMVETMFLGAETIRKLLKRLPTHGPRVLQGPGENAGAVDIGDAGTATQLVGHMDPWFRTCMDETQTLLRQIFQTENRVTFPLSASGSGGIEAAVLNSLATFTASANNQYEVNSEGTKLAFGLVHYRHG